MRKLISLTIIMVLFVMLTTSGMTANAMEANDIQVITNGDTTFLIESNGTVKGCGCNEHGELGIGTTENQNTPVPIDGLSDIQEIIPNTDGYGYFYAVNSSGNVYSWGYNGYGQLGLGNTTDQSTPTRIDSLPAISEIIVNNYTTYAITANGEVYAWGKNSYGQVGNGTTDNQLTPYKIENLPAVTALICKGNVAFALTVGKEVYAWGIGTDFQMGSGGFILAQTTPVKISGLSNVDEVVTNGSVSFTICDDGQEVYSWGEGLFGELGTNTDKNYTPKRIAVLSDLGETIDELIIEQNSCFAVTSDGTLYGWGSNQYCQLGNGTTTNKKTPYLIPNLPKVDQLIFNGYSGIALGVDHCVYTWGRNSYGEAGSGDQSRKNCVGKLTQLGSGIVEIYNGNNAMYAEDADGSLYGWGTNTLGQAGTGSTADITGPGIISELANVTSLEKTGNTVFASDSDGVIYGWGDNQCGQLGNGSTDTVRSPIEISVVPMTTAAGTGDVYSTVPVVGSINALTISITHPANIAYSIDPNREDGFCCADIHITNNSKVPVRITIVSFEASTDGDLSFEDVLPDSQDWDHLSLADSIKYIALGLQYADPDEWLVSESDFMDAVYAAEIDSTQVGVLARNATGTFALSAKHGLAFDRSYTANHNLVFLVSLY